MQFQFRPFVTVLVMLASVNAAADVRLALKADSAVRAPRVILGDVTTFESGNEVEARRLAAIDLGSAPLPGYTNRFTRKEIERLVRSGGVYANLLWQGADTVRVERITSPFQAVQISDAAEMSLRQLLMDGSTKVSLQLVAPLSDLQLPDGNVELKQRAMQAGQALHRRVTVWIDVLVDGTFVQSVAVPFNVQAYRSVLVAKRDLPKGAVPQCEALHLQEVDVAALNGVPLPADCQIVQGRLKGPLSQGTPLLKAHLQAPVAVAQGHRGRGLRRVLHPPPRSRDRPRRT